MKRRRFVVAGLASVACPLAFAQPRAKLRRIGYLSGLSADASKPWLAAFRQGLRDSGYAEGTSIAIDERYAAGQFDRLPGLAGELLRLEVDVFLIYSAEAARAAMAAAPSVPIVLANVGDPVANGLVKSLARPGGNITGLSDYHGASVTKRLELLRDIAPSAGRIGVLWRPGQPAHRPQLKDVEAAAVMLGLSTLSIGVQSLPEIQSTFAAFKAGGAGALLVLGDVLFTTHQAVIARLALENRLPAMYTTRSFVQAGGLIAYGASFTEMFRRAATYVDRILKGAKPGDLPIEQPTKFELRINLGTAKAIGVTVPRFVLLRADEVID